MTSLIETLRGWTKDEAQHYTYRHFPDPRAELDTLLPYASYFRVTLAQAFLRNSREWFREVYPAAHTSIRIQHANYDAVELTHVTHLPSEALAKGVDLNHVVTGLIPYNGGTLEIDCGLLALHGKDYLQASIKMLGSFSELIAAPINQALTIAGKVATNIQELFTSSNGEVQLNFGQAYSEGNPPRPGYHAVVLATADQLKDKVLSISDDRIVTNGTPLTGYDYLLFRLDGVKQRQDWRMKEIQTNINAAKRAYLRRKDDEGDEHRSAALVAVYDSPDLSEVDRTRVEQAIRDEIEPFRQPGRGAVGDGQADTSLDVIMKSAPTWQEAAEQVGAQREVLRALLKRAG